MYGFLKPEVAGCCESLEETLLFVNSEEGCNCQVHYIVHRPQEKLKLHFVLLSKILLLGL